MSLEHRVVSESKKVLKIKKKIKKHNEEEKVCQ